MILISSAAYVNSEFQIEFGRLPPAFLPVGNRRIFERQVDTLRKTFPEEHIYLSLPTTYLLSSKDEIVLGKLGVRILRSEETLSLAESVKFAISEAAEYDGSFRLLHGDTWLSEVPSALDLIGIVETQEDYSWEVEDVSTASESVWCGYFAFSDVRAFHASLDAAKRDFIGAVRAYDTKRPLQRCKVGGWHDFGHVNTYFQSRARLTTERSFNELLIADGCVRKSGTPPEKIRAEENWFRSIPPALRIYTPQLISSSVELPSRPHYVLEYLPLPPLNEVFVHGRNPVFYWDRIFSLCGNFLAACEAGLPAGADVRTIEASAAALAEIKTWRRLDQFVSGAGRPGLDTPLAINGCRVPSLRRIVTECLEQVSAIPFVPGILHGDLCLSNVLFDSRSDRIKVIDPRGLDEQGDLTIVGDLRYDLAKLTHSVIGLYDHIIAGAFSLSSSLDDETLHFALEIHIDERIKKIQEIFLERSFLGKLSATTVMPLTILLFLSMLPLHSDNSGRQTALLANALRLYSLFNSSPEGTT